jgi:hypothetical protein
VQKVSPAALVRKSRILRNSAMFVPGFLSRLRGVGCHISAGAWRSVAHAAALVRHNRLSRCSRLTSPSTAAPPGARASAKGYPDPRGHGRAESTPRRARRGNCPGCEGGTASAPALHPSGAESHLTRTLFRQTIWSVERTRGTSHVVIGDFPETHRRARAKAVGFIVNEEHLWRKCDPRHGASRPARGGVAAHGCDGFLVRYGGGPGQSCSPSRWPLPISWRRSSVSS